MIKQSELTFDLQKLRMRHLDEEQYFEMRNNEFPIESQSIFRTSDYKNIDKIDFELSSTVFRDFIEDIFGIEFGIDADGSSNHRNKLNTIIGRTVSTERGKTTVLTLNEYSEIIKSDEFTEFIVQYMNPREPLVSQRKKMLDELMFLQNNRYNASPEYVQAVRLKNIQVSQVINQLFPDLSKKIRDQITDENIFESADDENLFTEIMNYESVGLITDDDINIADLNDVSLLAIFLDSINKWNEDDESD